MDPVCKSAAVTRIDSSLSFLLPPSCKSAPLMTVEANWLVGESETGGGSRRLLILTLMMYSCSFADSSQRILKLLLETDEGGGGGDLRPKGVTTVPSKTASNPGMKWRSVGVWLVSRWRPEKDILQKSRPASSFAISIAF